MNRVIGDEEASGSYNFGLFGMKINGATYTQEENDQTYRSASGRSVTSMRAYTEKAFTNVYWNNVADAPVWAFSGTAYPVFVWQAVVTPSDPGGDDNNNGGNSGGNGGGSGGGGSSTTPAKPCDGGKDCPSAPYQDADTGRWYHEALDFVITNGLFKGLSAKEFGPDQGMTRAMFATVLYRFESKYFGAPAKGENQFTDVPDGVWYADGVAWAAKAGVVNGVGNGLFLPDGLVTREQMAAMLWRYAAYKGLAEDAASPALTFADKGDIGGYAQEPVTWAVANGILTGRSAAQFAPKANASRAEVAAVILRYYENLIQ